MPKVISLINLKGGVAKTTTTVQLAECLVSEHKKKVLVIDLDPQTNASIALISEEQWEELDRKGQTLYQLFLDKVEKTKKFNLESSIQKEVSTLSLPNLHLLASSIRFIEIQDRLHEILKNTNYMLAPVSIIENAIKPILNRYDYVLIDCPPNLGDITLNGIEISDYYLIPTIADTLSTYGIPQIIKKIKDYSSERNLDIKCLGLVVTKFDTRSSSQRNVANNLQGQFTKAFTDLSLQPAPVFRTKIPQATATASAMDYDESLYKSFKNKYGLTASDGRKVYEYVQDLTNELLYHAK